MAKEILKEEILSEEELDKVAGGTIAETVKDSQLLHALGLIDRAYTASEVQNNLDAVWREMDSAIFEAYGRYHSHYDYAPDANSANKYYYWEDGAATQLTREQFFKEVCQVAGKSNFDYTPYL